MELQKIEWKQPVSGNENTFVLALSTPVIRKSTVEEIKQVLRYAMVKIGLRAQSFPSDEEKQILLAHIISEYGNHTPHEIQLAFDMAIAGRLDLEEKEISCYENFSCLYFSKILNSYRRWSKEVFVQLKKDKPMEIENNAPLTDEEKAEWLMDWKIMDEVNIDLIPLIFYDFLNDKKLISLTKEQKWEYTERATTAIKVKLHEDMGICKTTDAYNAYSKFCVCEREGFDGEFKGRIINKAKRLVVYDYLKDKLCTPTAMNA